MTSRDYWLISWSTFLRYGSYAAIQTLWAGPFLIQHLGLGQVAAGQFLLLLNVGFIIGAPVMGFASEELVKSRKKIVLMGTSMLAACVLALTFWSGPSALPWLALVFFGLGFFGSSGNIMYPHIKNLMPQEMAGTALAGINFFTMMGAGAFSQGLGQVLARLSTGQAGMGSAYQNAFLICFVALVVIMAMYSLTREDRRRVKDQSD